MKKQYNGILLILVLAAWIAVLAGGCRKDQGNYTYNPVDSIGISNIEDNYEFSLGAKVNISPELKLLRGSSFNENDYSYEWASYAGTTSAKRIIHRGRNLDIEMPLGIGNYSLYYVVTQKSTGITWQKKTRVTINGTFQQGGWFVLNDIEGKARLDYYQEKRDTWNTFPVIYRGFTSLIKDVTTGTSMELTGKPLSLTAFHNRDVINNTSAYRLYINTDQETQWINITAGFTWDKLRYVFTNETIGGEPKNVPVIYPALQGGAYAYKDHQLYIYHTTYSLYGAPVNRISGVAGTFPIAEHLAVPFNNTMHAIFFDTQNKRFLRSFNTGVGGTVLTAAAQGLNLANVGKDLVWMGYTRSLQAVAILKDANNRYYLARLGFPYTSAAAAINVTVTSFEDITDRLTGLATADKFTIDQQFGYLFYVSGSKLYQYDMDNKAVKLAKDYGSRTISMLKFNTLTVWQMSQVPSNLVRFASPGYGIIVGSYDAQNPTTSGTVDFYTAATLMGDLVVSTPPFTGLGKVVDVKYNEL